MTLIATEGQRIGNVLKYETLAEIGYCRLAITINEATAKTYVPGQVLARSLVGGAAATPTINAGSTGNATSSAVTVNTTARLGTYTVLFTAATAFRVTDPQGNIVGYGATGSAFTGGGVGFTITAGGTAAVAGDSFSIVVTGTEKYKAVEAGTVGDGTAVLLLDNLGHAGDVVVPANTDTTVVALVRGQAAVADSALIFGASITTAAQKQAVYSALEAKGIMVLKQI